MLAMNPTVTLLEPDVRELIQQERYRDLRAALRELPPPDVADVLASLDPSDAAVAFRVLPREAAGEVFSLLEHDFQEVLLTQLGKERALRVIEAMEPDDRAALLDEMPPAVAQELINRLSPENRRITQQILNYPEDSVGRLMTPGYVRLKRGWTVEHALEHIRRFGRDAETINWVFVVDAKGKLIDDVNIRKLLLADPQTPMEDVLDLQFIALNATDDQEEAVRTMNRYDRTALPVVDATGALLGIVTYDDVADVAEAEATEDIQKLGGVEALDDPYMSTPLQVMLRKRGGWLAALFLGQTVTVAVLSAFEAALATAVVLTLFIPLVISCGGNSGSQAATLITRALALGEVRTADWWRIVRREVLTGASLGVLLGALALATFWFWHALGRAPTLTPIAAAFTVAGGVFGVVLWGTVLGSLLPLLMRRLKFDPASASTPLVATLMDASGMLIYLGIASVLMLRTNG